MDIAIYHPQLRNFGGGEMLCLTLASGLSKGHSVTIYSQSDVSKSELADFFGLDLMDVKIRPVQCTLAGLLPTTVRPLLLQNAIKALNHHEIVIDTGTNGWLKRKIDPKSICYIHFPFFHKKKTGVKQIMNPLILDPKEAFQYDILVCNSEFTKREVRRLTDKEIKVIYPPVETARIKPSKVKRNIIITVGRFTYEKKHEVMIDAFSKLKSKGWEMHMIGSFQEENPSYDQEYFDRIKAMAKKAGIVLHVNMPHEQVLRLLEESKIYWHARGFGEKDPNEYENFGITTVEAMAAGCLPIVVNLGAQPEIVKNGVNGLCWDSIDDLISMTKKAMKDMPEEMVKEAIKSSKTYSSERFIREMSSLL